MADPISIKHAFVLTKPNSPDASIVSTNAWNAEEKISGGQDGQLMARNSAVASGGSYVQGPRAYSAFESFSSAGATATPGMCTLTVTYTSNCDVTFIISVATALLSGIAAIVELYRDGVVIASRQVAAGGNNYFTFHEFMAEPPGTHTYAIIIRAFAASTITLVGARLTAQVFGKL